MSATGSPKKVVGLQVERSAATNVSSPPGASSREQLLVVDRSSVYAFT
jgi:hypothetical protein